MGDLVEFRRPPDDNVVWVCDCNCTTHYHHADGRVRCGACGADASEASGQWLSRLPPCPAEPGETDHASFKIVEAGTAENFLKRYAKADVGRPIAAIAIIYSDGAYSTWSGEIETDDQKAWVRRKLEEAGRRMTGETVKPES